MNIRFLYPMSIVSTTASYDALVPDLQLICHLHVFYSVFPRHNAYTWKQFFVIIWGIVQVNDSRKSYVPPFTRSFLLGHITNRQSFRI